MVLLVGMLESNQGCIGFVLAAVRKFQVYIIDSLVKFNREIFATLLVALLFVAAGCRHY